MIGEFHRLSQPAQAALREAIEFTKGGTSMVLSLALSYGGRHDITNAARALAERVRDGSLNPAEITEDLLRQELTTRSLPDVDLLIRTGGESRVSDFLLYESAYAELAFMPVMWPDFTEQHLLEAFSAYASRERRYGLTSAQVRDGSHGCHSTPAHQSNALERVLYRVD